MPVLVDIAPAIAPAKMPLVGSGFVLRQRDACGDGGEHGDGDEQVQGVVGRLLEDDRAEHHARDAGDHQRRDDAPERLRPAPLAGERERVLQQARERRRRHRGRRPVGGGQRRHGDEREAEAGARLDGAGEQDGRGRGDVRSRHRVLSPLCAPYQSDWRRISVVASVPRSTP